MVNRFNGISSGSKAPSIAETAIGSIVRDWRGTENNEFQETDTAVRLKRINYTHPHKFLRFVDRAS